MLEVPFGDCSPAMKMSSFEVRVEDGVHHYRRIGHTRDVERRLIDIGEGIGQGIAKGFEEVVIDLHVQRLTGFGAETVLDENLPGDIAALAR